jgi:hypothetical protein
VRDPRVGVGGLVLLVVVAFATRPALAQITGAQIDETKVQVLLYVDQSNPVANDANSGTSTSPFKTISGAVSRASQAAGGTKISIAPGVYREAISLANFNLHNPSPLILEASSSPGSVVVSGSLVWPGWTPQKDGTYTHSWPYSWGDAATPAGWPTLAPIVLRREMIFINGQPLRQVLSQSSLTPGSFFALDGKTITIYPPAGTQMSTAQVEVAARPALLSTPNGISNVVLRGLVFQHDNTAVNGNGTGAVALNGGSNILVDHCTFRYNNWTGLSAQGKAMTVTNTFADHNGEKGIGLYEVTNLVFNANQTSFNNWRGAAGNFTGWDAAGMKACRLHNATISNYVAAYNQTGGLWLDTDAAGIQLTGTQLCNNLTSGLFVEVSEGPVGIQSTSILSNGGNGLQVANSTAISLSNSLAYANGNAVWIGGTDAPVKVSNFETGAVYSLYSQGMSLQHNSLVGADSGQWLLSTSLSSSWTTFMHTFDSDFNDWSDPKNYDPIWTPAGGLSVGQWQSTTGEDDHSVATAPHLTLPTSCGVID